MSLDSRRRTRAAASDDKHVDIVIDPVKVNVLRLYPAVCLKQSGKLGRDLFALVCADLKHRELVLLVIGGIRGKEGVLLVSGHSSRLKSSVFGSLCRDLFH